MNILYIGSHSILEYDEVRLLSDLGHDVFSIGAYSDPAHPSDDKRPALPNVAYHPDLINLCKEQRVKHQDEDLRYYIDYAKADLHPDLLDWADVTIFAAFPDAWIIPQWAKLRSHRVIWRTIGQSDPSLEQYVKTISGLEIVRYSPAEKRAFSSIGSFAGEDAMIRFAKYPADYGPWIGDDLSIGNVTQDMAGRGEACGYSFWINSTKDLSAKPAGPKSEALPGGIGQLTYPAMLGYLAHLRAYLYTGTQPASYTLGFMEAMLTGTPIIAMSRERFGWPPIYEADDMAGGGVGDPVTAAAELRLLLNDPEYARAESYQMRLRGINLFDAARIGLQWQALLTSVPVAA